jgi:hypothetical protein
MNWQSGKITGTSESIGQKLKDSTLPQSAKDYIASEIATLKDATIVTVTAYSADHSNPIHPSAVTRNIQITISSASL